MPNLLLSSGDARLLSNSDNLLLTDQGAAYDSYTTFTGTGNSVTGITVDTPANMANGDLLVLVCVRTHPTPPLGTDPLQCGDWTNVLSYVAVSGTDRKLDILVHQVATPEPASYLFQDDNGAALFAAQMIRIEGRDTINPLDVAVTVLDGENDFTPTARPVTPVSDDSFVLTLAAYAVGNTTLSSKSGGAPAGSALIAYTGYDDIISVSVQTAYLLQTSAAAYNPGVWTGTTDDAISDWVTASLAFAVAPAATATPAADVDLVNTQALFDPSGASISLDLVGDIALPVTVEVPTPSVVVVDSDTTEAQYRLEWLPGVPPGTTAGTWVDITSSLQGGSVSRGRQYELDQFQAGEMRLTLTAEDRTWDPEFVAGAYFGQIIPMAQIRLVVAWAGTDYDVFYGYVTDWGQTVPESDTVFRTEITARDGFAWFELMGLGSWFDVAIRGTSPAHWWRFDETAGTTAVDTGTAAMTYDGRYINRPTLGGDPVVPFAGDGTAPTFFSGFAQAVSIPPAAVGGSTDFTIEVWFKTEAELTGSPRYLFSIGNTNGQDTQISVTDTQIAATCAVTGFLGAVGTYNDGEPHQAVLSRAGTTVNLYVDGELVDTDGATAAPLPSDTFRVGLGPDNNVGVGISPADLAWDGQESHLIFWDEALTDAEVESHWIAGSLGYAGYDTGAVLDALLTFKGWPSSLRAIDTGTSTMGSYDLPDTMQSMVQRLADTEAGQLYIDGAGNVVHRSRSALWADTRSNTAQAVYGDQASGETLVYVADGFDLHRDEALLRNPITASRSGGISVTAEDTAYSTDRYGERNWAAPAAYDSADVVMVSRAWAFLARYKELGTRLKAVRFVPQANSLLWPEVLGRQIGDRITIKRTPLGLGNQIETDQIIEGVTHTFSPKLWVTEFRGSPVDTTAYAKFDECKFDTVKFAY
jgi:hypothetical protein